MSLQSSLLIIAGLSAFSASLAAHILSGVRYARERNMYVRPDFFMALEWVGAWIAPTVWAYFFSVWWMGVLSSFIALIVSNILILLPNSFLFPILIAGFIFGSHVMLLGAGVY